MEKIVVMSIIAVSLLLGTGYAQETTKPAAGPAKTADKGAKRPVHRGAFTGSVSDVNIASSTVSVKERGSVVTFDASNPVFSGYRGLSDVRRGDRVAISYTPDGVRIARSTGKAPAEVKEVTATTPRKQSKDTGKLQRRERRGNGGSFDDVDANKDGRVTAVELSVLVTNITMDEFRGYDRNGDGVLDKREFLEMVKQQRQGR